MSNIICYDSDGNFLTNLYQWDNNQTITIRGIPILHTPVFHFCNRLSKGALVVSPKVSEGDITVAIPNILLQQAEPIMVYLYQNTENNGSRTVHTIHLPVLPRPKPDDYEYNENIDYTSIALLDAKITSLYETVDVDKFMTIAENASVIMEDTQNAATVALQAAARAEQVADGSAIEQLKTDLAPYIKEIENANWLNLETCESGNIDVNTGKVVPTDALRLSDYIPAKKDDIIRSYYVGANGTISSVSVVRYFFEFDANKNLLLRSENIPSNPYTVVNAETAYVRSCYAAQVFELSPMLFINPTEFPPTEYVAYSSGREVNIASKTQISEIKDELNLCTAKSSELEKQIDYLNDNSIKVLEYTPSDIEKIDGGYINAVSGKVGSNESYFYTNPYFIKSGDSVTVTSRDPSGKNVARISECTEDGNFIRTLFEGTTTETTVTYRAETDCYIRFSGYIANSFAITKKEFIVSEVLKSVVDNKSRNIAEEVADAKINGITKYNYLSYAMWKVLCIGDSLTSGAYYDEAWGEIATPGKSIDQNYPRLLGRMLGTEVTNGGFSGYSASNYYTEKLNTFDLSTFDTFIIWLGTNNGLTDTLDVDVEPYTDHNDYATTETGYYCKIIEAIKAANPSCLIVLTKIFASKGNVAVTNTVIDKIAAKYGLLVVDNSDISHTARPDLHCNISNPHFGKAGNLFIANRYIEQIGNYLNDDLLRCEFGITARTN